MCERRIVIMGAAGRDFHNFFMRYRRDDSVTVVAFTAAQIPGIDSRVFPASLAGPRYPQGIPIYSENDLMRLITDETVDEVVFAYSDVSHDHVMHHAEAIIAAGADFTLLGAKSTMLTSPLPVISVCGVRTGVGKSGIARHLFALLRDHGLHAVDVRHPMPYRNLEKMRVERYASLDDLDQLECTIEEREEYEPLIEEGAIVMAGVDYAAVLAAAEAEADVIVWDGGNNDLPFIAPDLEIVVLDPHRAGHERSFHPGEANFLRADVLVINKADSAEQTALEAVRTSAATFNPEAIVIEADSVIRLDHECNLTGKRVLVIEDGPTVTHGGMSYGAGTLAALRAGALPVDPRPFAIGTIAETLSAFPHLTHVLPAMGYAPEQLADLGATVRASDAEIILVATPIDLKRLIDLGKPSIRVHYSITERPGSPTLAELLEEFIQKHNLNTQLDRKKPA